MVQWLALIIAFMSYKESVAYHEWLRDKDEFDAEA